MRKLLHGAACAAGLAVAGGLVGCDAGPVSTRVTVMNGSSTPLVVDVATADSAEYLYRAERLELGAVRAFSISHPPGGETPVQVGVRPAEFAEDLAQWLEFAPEDGPYLLRVQGSAGALQFLPSRDVAELEATEIRQPGRNRLLAEPPVNPR